MIAWAATAGSPDERYMRLRAVSVFARYLRAEDPTHEMPDVTVFPAHRLDRRLPHIFTDNEVRGLLDAASTLLPAGSSRPDTYRTLFGLLASTGLRIGEALRLDLRDVATDGLLVRDTKFRKSRRVPLHPTVIAELQRYRAIWRVAAELDDPFFVSTKGTRMSRNCVFDTFDRIARDLGLRKAPPASTHRRPSPCLHDFRHSFAVRSLEAWRGDLASVNRHMLALSTYLGHGSVASTYWYLHVTPSLMTEIADACEYAFAGGGR